MIITNRQKLGISIVSALAAFGGMVWMFEGSRKKLESRYDMTQVLVAKSYIAQGKTLTPDLVEVRSVPVVFLQPTAMESKTGLASSDGTPLYKTRVGVLKGEQVTRSKLADQSALLSLAWVLPANQTAATLHLDPDAAVGGLLRPGDWVSVVAAWDRQPGIPEPRAELLMPRVQVMAVDGRIWEPGSALLEKNTHPTMARDPILVTLALSFDDSARLALARSHGRLTLALQSALQTEPVKGAPARLSKNGKI